MQQINTQGRSGAISQYSELQLNNFLIKLTHGLGNVLSERYTTGKGFGSDLCSILLVCS